VSQSFIHLLIRASFAQHIKHDNPVIRHVEVIKDSIMSYIVETGPEDARKQRLCVEGFFSPPHDEILLDLKSDHVLSFTAWHASQNESRWHITYGARNAKKFAIWRDEQCVSPEAEKILRIHSLEYGEPRCTLELEPGRQAIFAGKTQISLIGSRISDVMFEGDQPRYQFQKEEHSTRLSFLGMNPKVTSSVTSYQDYVQALASAST
jgi:hypothetical protein